MASHASAAHRYLANLYCDAKVRAAKKRSLLADAAAQLRVREDELMHHEPYEPYNPERHSHHKKPKKRFDGMTIFLGVMIVAAIAFVLVFGQLG